MTRAHKLIGLLAAAACCAGPFVAVAQSPLSPAPMSSQPIPAAPAIPVPAVPVPAVPTAPVSPVEPPPAAQAPSVGTPTAEAPAAAAPLPAPVRPKAKPKPKPRPAMREMALSDDPTPVLQPETFFATAKASERYANIVDAGGWPVVPARCRPGQRGRRSRPCAGVSRSRAISSAPKGPE